MNFHQMILVLEDQMKNLKKCDANQREMIKQSVQEEIDEW